MTDADLRDRLTSVFRDFFDDPSIAIFDRMTAADVDGWDSLTRAGDAEVPDACRGPPRSFPRLQ
jgi:hypothetical protein